MCPAKHKLLKVAIKGVGPELVIFLITSTFARIQKHLYTQVSALTENLEGQIL